jgi:hypothetical protein
MTTHQRIRAFRHTSEEVAAARKALPYYVNAYWADKSDAPGGVDPRRYKGRTADDVVDSLVSDERRRRLVLSLVVAMAGKMTRGDR